MLTARRRGAWRARGQGTQPRDDLHTQSLRPCFLAPMSRPLLSFLDDTEHLICFLADLHILWTRWAEQALQSSLYTKETSTEPKATRLAGDEAGAWASVSGPQGGWRPFPKSGLRAFNLTLPKLSPTATKKWINHQFLQGLKTPWKCQVRCCGVDVFAHICGASPQLSTKELGFQRRVRTAIWRKAGDCPRIKPSPSFHPREDLGDPQETGRGLCLFSVSVLCLPQSNRGHPSGTRALHGRPRPGPATLPCGREEEYTPDGWEGKGWLWKWKRWSLSRVQLFTAHGL